MNIWTFSLHFNPSSYKNLFGPKLSLSDTLVSGPMIRLQRINKILYSHKNNRSNNIKDQ